MREAFADELTRIAQEDHRVVLLAGDIGNWLFDPFREAMPDRFYNCGVAEANMASMAAGLASAGFRPVTYTITPFNTTRCLEQIRNDICYHKQPVVIVGAGAGLSYGSLGYTHHSCEDIAMLRSLPGLTIVAPGDAHEVRILLREAVAFPGPIYFRIGKAKEPLVHQTPPVLQIGKAHILKHGELIGLISTGNLLPLAHEVHASLSALGFRPALVSMHTIKPLDTEALKPYRHLCVFEEHSKIGGLGAAVAEWMADVESDAKLFRFGTPDALPHRIGSQGYLRNIYGLTSASITECITRGC